MKEDVFNLELRKFLKTFGITAQREVEKAVDKALANGKLEGGEKLRARARLVVEGLEPEVVVEGTIALE